MTPDKLEDRRNLDVGFAGGLAWTAGAKWATQVFTWAAAIAVARLLSQTDVGIGAIAGIFFGLTNVLAEFGVGTAVLHMPELDRRTLGQLHLFSLLFCAGIFALSIAAVPGMAWFFKSYHVVFFIANNAAFLITGIQAVPMGLLQRDMDYRRLKPFIGGDWRDNYGLRIRDHCLARLGILGFARRPRCRQNFRNHPGLLLEAGTPEMAALARHTKTGRDGASRRHQPRRCGSIRFFRRNRDCPDSGRGGGGDLQYCHGPRQSTC